MDQFTNRGSYIHLAKTWKTIDILSIIRKSKTGFLPNCSCVHTTMWVHHMGANKMHSKKVRWALHKNAASCFQQILEAIPHKKVSVRPLSFHLIQVRRTRHTGHGWRSKDELISDGFLGMLHMDVPVMADQQRLIYTSSVRTQDETWERLMVGMDGERESGNSMLLTWLDDDDNMFLLSLPPRMSWMRHKANF